MFCVMSCLCVCVLLPEEEMRKIPKEDMIWIIGVLNGHIGKENTGYEEAHGGVGYGERNAEGEMILEFCQTF